ncbi:type 1 glutamine amidotransferase domain-containing protein [Streptomyces sparsogenes]|uniref:ThiJ/PfpI domain-containing protein n=1 Tax=Streptomyces sparsogenes DSM 40356 TaxID=1331668 RepID=A0A1R1SBR6_9ACTN|nr:type 1 glutamine amidotransferase domain-containing protein [Streptomyces sparsogenes]OMI35841.1 ThiJ/PfpI domain-containing protein [Streptomyces sparsogenes DSM 40356]
MSKILMVLSAADSLTLADGSTHPTGFWAEEVAASHQALCRAGAQVDLATPGAARPIVDALSLDARGGVSEADAQEFRSYLDFIAGELAAPLSPADVRMRDYDALYIPGGHAPMADLAHDADLGRLLNEAYAEGTTITALCHGVAALLSATAKDGSFAFAGRTLTSFSDEEERQGGLGENTPFFVESRLRERGAQVTTGAPWSSTVVEDGILITRSESSGQRCHRRGHPEGPGRQGRHPSAQARAALSRPAPCPQQGPRPPSPAAASPPEAPFVRKTARSRGRPSPAAGAGTMGDHRPVFSTAIAVNKAVARAAVQMVRWHGD